VKLTHYAEHLATMSLRDLDATDHKILSILQIDGRISNLELAQKVGLSPTPCSRRVRRLEQRGIITGYGAKVDLSNQREGIGRVAKLVEI
jgi:Lrp/AsnC family leucine-responsive transcriptional regulator